MPVVRRLTPDKVDLEIDHRSVVDQLALAGIVPASAPVPGVVVLESAVGRAAEVVPQTPELVSVAGPGVVVRELAAVPVPAHCRPEAVDREEPLAVPVAASVNPAGPVRAVPARALRIDPDQA